MIPTKVECYECGRTFDLMSVKDSDEWYSGHDCEEGN